MSANGGGGGGGGGSSDGGGSYRALSRHESNEGSHEALDPTEALEQAIEEVTGEALKEAALESAIEDGAYERIIVNAPDVVRDIVREMVVERYAEDEAGNSPLPAPKGAGALSATLAAAAGDAEGGGLPRSTSHPTLPEPFYPDVQHASDINVPGGFRRDFIIPDDDQEEVPESAKRSFLEGLMADNSALLYAWIEHGVHSDDESDDESDAETPDSSRRSGPRRLNMVFSSYGRRSLHRRMSEYENDEEVKSGSRKTLLTLFKCFVATGVMFLPNAFGNAGLVAGLLTLLFIGIISLYGMNLLIATRAHLEEGGSLEDTPRTPLLSEAASNAVTNTLFPRKPKTVSSYSQLGMHAFGYVGKRLVQMSILLSQIGFCCVYVSFVGNSLSSVMHRVKNGLDWPLWSYMVLTIPIVTPLTLIRHLKYFAIPNLIATVFVAISLIYGLTNSFVTISRGTNNDWSCDGAPDSGCLWINPSMYPMFLGSSVYAFEGITMVIPVQNSMKQPEKLPGMLKGVVILVTFIFCSFGALNYYTYGAHTAPIIVDNFPIEGAIMVTGMFVVVAIFMFPLMTFPAARIIEKRLFKKLRRSGYKWQKNFIRASIVLLCVAVSVGAGKKVDKLVALIGGLFCVPLALVYPPLFYIKSGAAQDMLTEVVPAYLLLGFGLASAVLSTYISVAQFAAPEK